MFKRVGPERHTKLTFVTGFPDAISIELQQVPNIENLPMGDLRARVLMMTEDQSQDVVSAMCPLHSNTTVTTRSSPSNSVTWGRGKVLHMKTDSLSLCVSLSIGNSDQEGASTYQGSK